MRGRKGSEGPRDRQTDRQTDREKESERERERERSRERERERLRCQPCFIFSSRAASLPVFGQGVSRMKQFRYDLVNPILLLLLKNAMTLLPFTLNLNNLVKKVTFYLLFFDADDIIQNGRNWMDAPVH